MAKAAGVLSKLFGPHSLSRQFFVWSVASEVVQVLMQPFLIALGSKVNAAFPHVPLSPNEYAGLVLRGALTVDDAADGARKSGVNGHDFDHLVTLTGGAPSPLDLVTLYRRGKLDRDRTIRGLRQSSIKNEWIDVLLEFAVQPPTPTEILRARLQGQVSEAESRELYASLGGDPEFFELLYNTEGSAPTPNEAAEMARKGIIPWEGSGPGVVSFEQAFLEGPWRNKWLPAFKAYADYLPPPRTITAMLREGSLTEAEATDLLRKQGVPMELVPAYLSEASSNKTKAAKELTESTISALFQEFAIDESLAADLLQNLRYTPDEAEFVILSWQLAREMKYRNTAISTVHSQFTAHKISESDASLLLDSFRVPTEQRDALLRLWAIEARARVQILTPAQVKSAMKKGIIEPQEAVTRLVTTGYTQQDAEIFLSI